MELEQHSCLISMMDWVFLAKTYKHQSGFTCTLRDQICAVNSRITLPGTQWEEPQWLKVLIDLLSVSLLDELPADSWHADISQEVSMCCFCPTSSKAFWVFRFKQHTHNLCPWCKSHEWNPCGSNRQCSPGGGCQRCAAGARVTSDLQRRTNTQSRRRKKKLPTTSTTTEMAGKCFAVTAASPDTRSLAPPPWSPPSCPGFLPPAATPAPGRPECRLPSLATLRSLTESQKNVVSLKESSVWLAEWRWHVWVVQTASDFSYGLFVWCLWQWKAALLCSDGWRERFSWNDQWDGPLENCDSNKVYI